MPVTARHERHAGQAEHPSGGPAGWAGALGRLPWWAWVLLAGAAVLGLLWLSRAGGAAAPSGYSIPSSGNLGAVGNLPAAGYTPSAGLGTSAPAATRSGSTSAPAVALHPTPAPAVPALPQVFAPAAVRSGQRPPANLASLAPAAAAVVTGASRAPLSAVQVQAIQAAEGGTPLTGWQARWLRSGGRSAVPAIPGGPGPQRQLPSGRWVPA